MVPTMDEICADTSEKRVRTYQNHDKIDYKCLFVAQRQIVFNTHQAAMVPDHGKKL